MHGAACTGPCYVSAAAHGPLIESPRSGRAPDRINKGEAVLVVFSLLFGNLKPDICFWSLFRIRAQESAMRTSNTAHNPTPGKIMRDAYLACIGGAPSSRRVDGDISRPGTKEGLHSSHVCGCIKNLILTTQPCSVHSTHLWNTTRQSNTILHNPRASYIDKQARGRTS